MGSEEFAKACLFYSKKEENEDMAEKRVLTGYSKEVQADFERLKKDSTCPLLVITGGLETLDSLNKLIVSANSNEDKQILQDIADFINNKAKFPEQKYYVKLLDRDKGYLNYQHSFNEFFVDDKDDYEDGDYKTQFTISEIEDIDPRYMAFAVPVEEEKWRNLEEKWRTLKVQI